MTVPRRAVGAPDPVAPLVQHLVATTGLDEAEARRVVGDVVAFHREGVDDLRYLGTLRNAIAAAQKTGGAKAKLAAQAQVFLDGMDVTGDLYAIRDQMIDWTLKLSK